METKAEISPIQGVSACSLKKRLASGELSSSELCEKLLAYIARHEPELQSFVWLKPEYVMAEAEKKDEYRKAGAPLGILHGLPVAMKDIIDTAGIPTENGTALDSGRVPNKDASVVSLLKAAGAIILGKTASTELAFMKPAKTRNPVNPAHTPGGSSAGSAAAVAAKLTPLALGTQTAGSVIRPASYCGAYGFKPSFGRIPRSGILTQSPTLDTVGMFAMAVEDLALLGDAIFDHDPEDETTAPMPPPELSQICQSPVPVKPTLAFLDLPYMDQACSETHAALEELEALLGEQAFRASLPESFSQGLAARECIHFAEMAKCYRHYQSRAGETLSDELKEALEQGMKISAFEYLTALDWIKVLTAGLEELFARCDALVTPAAPSFAPKDLETTGNPIFNSLWTLCGTPAVALPLFEAENGMPMGIQLVGPRGGDARLLRTARWLEHTIRKTESIVGE